MRFLVLMSLVAACASPPPPTPSPVFAAPDSGAILLRRVEQSSASGSIALEAFQPAVPATDSAPQCSVTRTRGSGATRVSARFSAPDSSSASVTLWFDSVGTLVRYSDVRGSRVVRLPAHLSLQQRDSALRARLAAQTMTFINFDFAIDEARASNTANGRALQTISGTVRELEHLPALGPPLSRIRRVRDLCGV